MLERLSQLPPREQVGLSLACAAILMVAADHFVVRPVFAELDRMDVSIAVKEKEITDYHEALRYKGSVEKQYNEVKNLIGVSSSDQDPIDFKGRIDDIALQKGIRVNSRKLLKETTTDFLVTYFLQIGGFEAEMSALINFLNEIQQTPGLLRVQNLTITSQTENNAVKGTLTISKAMTLAEKQE